MPEVLITGIMGDDLKHVMRFIGLDLTDSGITFEISPGPEQAAVISPVATLLSVETDDDGIPTSTVEIFASAPEVRTAVDSLGGLEDGRLITLYYQLRLDGIPGDLGSTARTTILFGDYAFKGEAVG